MNARLHDISVMSGKRFGKYLGTVESATDPQSGGRLRVTVPDVHGRTAVWAMPCVPYADRDAGFFMLPPVGTKVWVEFAAGDHSRAIWTGCIWQDGQVPSRDPTVRTIKTPEGAITFNSKTPKGEVVISNSQNGLNIILNGGKITIQSGKGAEVVIEGRKTSVNAGALDVQ